MEVSGKLQQISHCSPCALNPNTDGWILQWVLGSWGFFGGKMEHGAAGQAPLVVACCLWVGRAQLAPAASLGHMGYRLGLPGGLEPEPVPHCPVPSQSLIWGFSVSGWTGGRPPSTPALPVLRTHPRRRVGRGQALGAGREDSDGDQRGTRSYSEQKKTSIFRYQQMTLREKKASFYTYIQHLSSSPAVE